MLLINNEEWDLQFVDPYSSVLLGPNGEYSLGVTIPEWRKIYINDQLYGIGLKRVLSHEIAHAEFATRGLIVPVYVEECLADIISDNIVDTYNLTNEICYYLKTC